MLSIEKPANYPVTLDEIDAGDKGYVSKAFGWHCVTFVRCPHGELYVAHRLPDGYRIEPAADYVERAGVVHLERAAILEDPADVWERALDELDAPHSYSLFANNCEHTCDRVADGGPGRSPQVAKAVIGGLAVAGVIAGIYAITRG